MGSQNNSLVTLLIHAGYTTSPVEGSFPAGYWQPGMCFPPLSHTHRSRVPNLGNSLVYYSSHTVFPLSTWFPFGNPALKDILVCRKTAATQLLPFRQKQFFRNLFASTLLIFPWHGNGLVTWVTKGPLLCTNTLTVLYSKESPVEVLCPHAEAQLPQEHTDLIPLLSGVKWGMFQFK